MTPILKERQSKIETYIQSHREEMLQALRDAVEIKSPSDYAEGTNDATAFFQSLVPELGAKASRLDGGVYGDHLLLESENTAVSAFSLLATSTRFFQLALNGLSALKGPTPTALE